MSKDKVVRAWKDPKYRASLTPKEKAELPEHPAGDSGEIGDEELDKTAGGEVFPVTSGGYICTLTTECGCPWGKSN